MKTRINVLILFMIAAFSCPSWSGTTGKIAGTVVDKTTGEPLVAANVVVVGTSSGAAADMNGEYSILRVPPGYYDLQVTMIGYEKTTITNVRVLIDQTAHVNVKLEPQAIEAQTLTIVAERDLIKTDVATSVVAVSDREVEQLPVTYVENVIGMQAGIQGMSIRGGGADDALFLLDGTAMRDPRNNQPIGRIALSAVKEISVERGGFNAEYGQVQSGLINVVTKEGSKHGYFGSITYKMSPPAPKYFQGNGTPDVQDPDSYWMRPYLDDAVCWTGTSRGEPFTDQNSNGKWDSGEPFQDLNKDGSRTFWDQYTRDQYLDFNGWNEVSQQLLTDDDPNNDLTPLGCQRVFEYETRKKQPNDLSDYDIDAGFGGPVPLISKMAGDLRFFTSYRRHRDVLLWPQARPDYVDYDWTMQVTSDLTPNMKLRLSSLMGNIATLAENWNYGTYPHYANEIAGGTGGYQEFNMFSNWAWSESDIGHRSFSAKLTHTLNPQTFYEVSLDHFRREYNTRPTTLRNTAKSVQVVPGFWVDEYPLGYWPSEVVGITPHMKDGLQASLARDATVTSSTTLKADLTSQLNFSNMAKAGVEFVYNDLDMNYGFIQMSTKGESYGQHVQMHNFPIRAAAYVQDKLESQGFTLNAGLRADYSYSRTDWWNIDPYDPYFISSKYNPDRTFEIQKSKPQWQLSPRLSISHPITENSKLFFNYGHFKEMPQYETLFRIDRASTLSLNRIGDPNLTLAKTVSYELGYDQVLPFDLLMQMAAFYRDIFDQQNTTHYNSINSGNYYLTTSNNYEDIRGFEFTLRKTMGRWFSGFLNYTYQVATSGTFGSPERYEDPSRQKKYEEETVHLYQDRPYPTPYARANLNFFTPDDFGPALLQHHVLGGAMLNFVLNWQAGGYTTYNPKNVSGVLNNIHFVDNYDGTLRASKTITVKRFRIQLLMDVNNLFNRLRLRDTGNLMYRQSLHLAKSEAYDNIVGNDKFGDYRKQGVKWQPMQYRAEIEGTPPPEDTVPIYYEGKTGKYWEIVDGQWAQVAKARIDQINNDKAYIFNSGPSTWYFLNPRSFFFGVRLSFDLN
jgi:outer membrane receptor protein involved in Fe transport